MPVFGLLESCLRHCDVRGFDAIFNATTNFIIEAVGDGREFDEALAQVQAEGYAEADPSHDIDGVDAGCKTAALANVAMNAGITPKRVRAAAAHGHKLCVLCSAGPAVGRQRCHPLVPWATARTVVSQSRLEKASPPRLVSKRLPELPHCAFR